MTNTLISVIIVVYNSAQYIERAIKSVINQTYFHIDFIVIDGGSTDGTVDIIKSYSNYISYWKSEPDKGIYDAMNKGWKQAKGDYILYLGADDLLLPDGLKYLTENSENFDVVYGNAIYMHPGNIEKKQKNVDYHLIKRRPITSHQALMMKTCLINKLNGFDCRYKILADYELILKAYMNGASFKQIDKNIAKFNMGGISSCNFRNDYEKYLIHQKYASLKYPFLYFLLMICRKFLIVLKYQFTKLIQQ